MPLGRFQGLVQLGPFTPYSVKVAMQFCTFLRVVSPHLEMGQLLLLMQDLPGILAIHTNLPCSALVEEAAIQPLEKEPKSPLQGGCGETDLELPL